MGDHAIKTNPAAGLYSFRRASTQTMTTTTRTTTNFKVRESLDRCYANHGWLSTYHTFSFADYDDSQFNGWSSLRVLNEDRVKPGRGFGAHPHQNYEIFSY